MTPEDRPLVLIDVDDVLNLIEFSSASRRHLAFHHGWRRGKAWSDGREYQLIVNPAHGKILRGLAEITGAELAWATTLEDAANRHVAPLLGLPALPTVVPAPVGEKATHAVPWTAGRPFVWLDNDEDELSAAESLTREKGQPYLGVRVDPAIGLTAANAELAREWLAGVAPAHGDGAFEDVNQPCGDAKCPWARERGGPPKQGKAARHPAKRAAATAARLHPLCQFKRTAAAQTRGEAP